MDDRKWILYVGRSGEPPSSLGRLQTMKPTTRFRAALQLSLPPTEADLNLSLEGNGSCGPSLPCHPGWL